jgi:hypothetical protein
MVFAYEAAERLGIPTLRSNMGYYLLGSTAPDMRAITRRTREEYHFAPLSFTNVGAGVEGLLEANPHLLRSSNGNGPTRAFVAGYMTHLVLDEAWIVDMYRVYFGNPKVYRDSIHGKVMDRALQMELDRLSQEGLEATVPLLAQATGSVDVGFIPQAAIGAWQAWVLEFMERGFTWERLRHMARRIAAGDDDHPAHRMADEFLRAMPGSLDRLYEHVSRDDLASFRERATGALASTVRDYLS